MYQLGLLSYHLLLNPLMSDFCVHRSSQLVLTKVIRGFHDHFWGPFSSELTHQLHLVQQVAPFFLKHFFFVSWLREFLSLIVFPTAHCLPLLSLLCWLIFLPNFQRGGAHGQGSVLGLSSLCTYSLVTSLTSLDGDSCQTKTALLTPSPAWEPRCRLDTLPRIFNSLSGSIFLTRLPILPHPHST